MQILGVLTAFLIAVMVVGCGGSGGGSVALLANDQSLPVEQDDNDQLSETNSSPATNPLNSGNSGSTVANSAGLTGRVEKLGLVEFQSVSSLSSGLGREYITANAVYTVQQYDLTASAQLDTCTLYQNGSVVEGVIEDATDYVAPEFIDAGEVFPISSASGSYGELKKTSDALQTIAYEADLGTLTYPAPNGLAIDIAGGEFPAFSNIPIPDLEELVVIDNPRVDGDVDYGNPSFRWVASSDPNTIIAITLTVQIANVDTVFCTVKDDGEFDLPAFANIFSGGNYAYASRNILRKINNYKKQNEALLITSRISTHSFDTFYF